MAWAMSGCGYTPPTLKPNAWHPSARNSGILQFADYRPGEEQGGFVLTDYDGWHHDAPIVGMRRFSLVTPGPNGSPVVVDDGYAQWHMDGTEIQNSGLHASISSNFCLGVWKEVGFNRYQLNHFPLAWDSNGLNPANAIQLTETVQLKDANHMTGTLTLKVYPWTTTDSLDVSAPPPRSGDRHTDRGEGDRRFHRTRRALSIATRDCPHGSQAVSALVSSRLITANRSRRWPYADRAHPARNRREHCVYRLVGIAVIMPSSRQSSCEWSRR